MLPLTFGSLAQVTETSGLSYTLILLIEHKIDYHELLTILVSAESALVILKVF